MKQPPNFLRALSSRNYRLYLGGQCISLLGNWMTATASMWLVYRLSASPFAVGTVVFAQQIFLLLLAPFVGVLIDRTDALSIMRTTQVLLMLQSAAMAAFTLSGHMTVAVLIELSVVQGVINAFDFSCRQTLVYELAGKRELVENVVALNSISFNLARLVGPAIAGFVIAAVGSGMCFAIDAVSYLAVLFALVQIKLPRRARPANPAHPYHDLKQGVAYAWGHPSIRRVLLITAVIALAGYAHLILAPVFAKSVFHGDARTLGYLLSAIGAGSLLSGLYMTLRRSETGVGGLIAGGAVITGAGLVTAGFSPGLPLALAGYAAAGVGCATVMIASNSWLQMLVEDDKRGRVMSLYQMSAGGFYPIGALMDGALGERFGPRHTLFICAVVCLLGGLAFARFRNVTGLGLRIRRGLAAG